MTGKRYLIRFLILCLALLTCNVNMAQRVNTVVLDAGHGGHDTGALGRNSREKDITLAVVLKLRDCINQNMKDVKVILTRSDDHFVELYRRARIANENKADLFISVHCNATKSTSAYGVETFVMGLHKSEANLAVAKAENAAILLEDDYVEKYDGFDPESAEGNIFFSMMQNAFLDRSLDFAGKVQKQFVSNMNLFNRGVKQAGFLVLYKTAMPGVLIETGFISNPNDEKYLLSEKGQQNVAEAIFNALKTYKSSLEKPTQLAHNQKDTTRVEKGITKPSQHPAENVGAAAADPPITSTAASQISFKVQFASSPVAKPLNSSEFKAASDVWQYFHGGLYKYTSGNFTSLRQALEHRSKLVKAGYKDAFVVAFNGDTRISIDEAKSILEKL